MAASWIEKGWLEAKGDARQHNKGADPVGIESLSKGKPKGGA